MKSADSLVRYDPNDLDTDGLFSKSVFLKLDSLRKRSESRD